MDVLTAFLATVLFVLPPAIGALSCATASRAKHPRRLTIGQSVTFTAIFVPATGGMIAMGVAAENHFHTDMSAYFVFGGFAAIVGLVALIIAMVGLDA